VHHTITCILRPTADTSKHLYTTAYVKTTSKVNTPTADYILWTDIQDIVGPATSWPDNIRLFFWTRHLSHWERIRMAAFVWVNGLNPEVYYDWFQLKRFFNRGSPTQRHYQQLFAYLRQGRRYALWAWHVLNRRYEWIDGSIRVPPRNRQRRPRNNHNSNTTRQYDNTRHSTNQYQGFGEIQSSRTMSLKGTNVLNLKNKNTSL